MIPLYFDCQNKTLISSLSLFWYYRSQPHLLMTFLTSSRKHRDQTSIYIEVSKKRKVGAYYLPLNHLPTYFFLFPKINDDLSEK
jgi:hypothetical protein